MNTANPREPNDPNLNTGKPWSETDIFRLKVSFANGDSAEKTATFLLRTKKEIEDKLKELGPEITGLSSARLRSTGRRTIVDRPLRNAIGRILGRVRAIRRRV